MDLQVKYRPKKLREFVGNLPVIKAIYKDYKSGNLKHTIMLTGASGVGKTTLAYIIARELLKCHELSVVEKNAADTRGVDDARSIIRDLGNRPLIGENKVFIIDEAHQLTKEAQNALLKPLEDAKNNHVYWIFCTTEPAGIIKTIKTRAAQYSLDLLNVQEITQLLAPIIEQEKISLPEEALKLIVRKADGVPREAVKLLDQLRNLDDPLDVQRVLSEYKVEAEEFINLVAFLKKPWQEIGPKLKKLYEKKPPESIRIGLLSYYRVVLENARGIKDKNLALNIMEALTEPIYSVPKEAYCSMMLCRVNEMLRKEDNGTSRNADPPEGI
jgi:DNA polymerase III gamma/tau subunit